MPALGRWAEGSRSSPPAPAHPQLSPPPPPLPLTTAVINQPQGAARGPGRGPGPALPPCPAGGAPGPEERQHPAGAARDGENRRRGAFQDPVAVLLQRRRGGHLRLEVRRGACLPAAWWCYEGLPAWLAGGPERTMVLCVPRCTRCACCACCALGRGRPQQRRSTRASQLAFALCMVWLTVRCLPACPTLQCPRGAQRPALHREERHLQVGRGGEGGGERGERCVLGCAQGTARLQLLRS